MPAGKGRGKLNYADLKKDENTVAGPKSASVFSTNTSELSMDEYLKKFELCRKPVAKDGSCLFRVVSEYVFKTQAYHQVVREDCIKFMRDNKKIFESFIEGSFEHHLFCLKNLKEWGGHSEISALSLLYKYDFIVYQLASPSPQDVTNNGFDKKVRLCYLNNNHYDCVLPISFKTNAAFVQSILYELLLDNVFAEIDRREIKSITDSSFVEETQSSGWTEVKNKQNKGKPQETVRAAEDTWDHVIAAIHEASKNPKVNQSLKASLDPSIYRNVDLEVWESSRTEQQRQDLEVAVSYQYKIGDLCLATMHESKDISKTLRVKIHKIMVDKCIVLSEHHEKQYYVHLDDLKPVLNGEADYKSLPGYYNKFENEKDQDFHPQKRRGKHGRKVREEERKDNVLNNDQNNGRIRTEKDSRNRRNPRNGGNKKDIEGQRSSSIKSKENNKRSDKYDMPTSEKTNSGEEDGLGKEDGPGKVAKPAETAAAFWGRMRNKPATAQPLNGTTDGTVVDYPSEMPSTQQQPLSSKKLNNLETASEKLNSIKLPSTQKNRNITTDGSTANSSNPASPKSVPYTTTMTTTTNSIVSAATPISKKAFSTTAPVILPKLSRNSSELVNTVAKGLPTTTNFSTKSTSSTNYVHTSTIISSSIEHDTRKFNLTTQASAKVNEVRENLILSTAKMEGLCFLDTVSTKPSVSVVAQNNTKQSPQIIETDNKDTKILLEEKLPDPKQNVLIQEKNIAMPIVVDDNKDEQSAVEGAKTKSNEIPMNDISSYEPPKHMHDVDYPHVTSAMNLQEKLTPFDSSSNVDISNDSLEVQKKSLHVKTGRDKAKKKVSFGCTTEIVEKATPMLIAASTVSDHNVHAVSSVEPGKIHLPPEHIEKHLNNFPCNTTSVPYPEVVPQQLEQQPQPQPRIVQPFFQSGIPFYPHQQTHMSPVVPMFYRANIGGDPRSAPQLSHDPEGKDLPEDIGVLQYFYNLGVQYVYAQSVHQMNHQTGILPLPVVTSLQPRPFVLNADTVQRTGDLINANSQTNETSQVEMQQQQAQPNILQTRIQTPHINFHHSHIQQQGAHFEEYETPPRLRRSGGPIPSGSGIGMGGHNAHRPNQRHFIQQQRQILNGRGIMGQGPKFHRADHIRMQIAYQPPM